MLGEPAGERLEAGLPQLGGRSRRPANVVMGIGGDVVDQSLACETQGEAAHLPAEASHE